MRKIGSLSTLLIIVCVSMAAARSARADTVGWTDWTSYTNGATTGSATGSISSLGITLTYSGEVEGYNATTPSWTPSTSYAGGSIANAPPAADGALVLFGAQGATDTVTFSAPVVDPTIAVWSLGEASLPASFDFTASEPFTIEAGGPSSEYGGSSLYVCADNADAVCGEEGNGTIQLDGTFSSITWTNPGYENYYDFTIGAADPPSDPVPEPSSLLQLGVGVLGLAAFSLKRKCLA